MRAVEYGKWEDCEVLISYDEYWNYTIWIDHNVCVVWNDWEDWEDEEILLTAEMEIKEEII